MIVAPITATKRNYPLCVAIPNHLGMKTTGKIMLDQLITIDYEARLYKFLAELLTKTPVIFSKGSLVEIMSQEDTKAVSEKEFLLTAFSYSSDTRKISSCIR